MQILFSIFCGKVMDIIDQRNKGLLNGSVPTGCKIDLPEQRLHAYISNCFFKIMIT